VRSIRTSKEGVTLELIFGVVVVVESSKLEEMLKLEIDRKRRLNLFDREKNSSHRLYRSNRLDLASKPYRNALRVDTSLADNKVVKRVCRSRESRISSKEPREKQELLYLKSR
jgi:hypothetical protein